MTFKYVCDCKKNNFLNKDFSYWENRNTTSDENDIINYVNNLDINYDSLLHIGIGNSDFANYFCKKGNITGITISKKEILKAKSLNLVNYEVLLCDKYSLEFNDILQKKRFDLILDTNLKSYSCCHKSFLFFMKNLASLLKKGGKIITSRKGMSWYKNLKPKLSFNFKDFFYYKLKEKEGNKKNIFTLDEANKLADSLSLEVISNKNILTFNK
mgnify:CR=1 FL=1|tara:strand:+ start:3043 stop:3681 length:639 start_codon:yes stop_codon:yes gene_type:complete